MTNGSGGPQPRRATLGVFWIIAFVVVGIPVLGIASLYAVRAQGPAQEPVAYQRVLSELQEGQVRSVVIEGDRATVTLADGHTQQATTPGDDQLARAIVERNRADPAHSVALRYQPAQPGIWLPMMMGMGLLPLFVLITLIVLAALLLSRSSRRHRYETLSRLADLRDRSAITEDEFQREKRRLLR